MSTRNLSMVLTIVLLTSSDVSAQNFFWSDFGFEQGAVEGDLVIDAVTGDMGTAFLYYTPNGQDIETGFDLDFGFDVFGIVGFSAAETFQSAILLDTGTQQVPINNRWSNATGTGFGSASVTVDAVTNFAANSVPGFDGIQVENTPLFNGGTATIDSLYDVDAGAFLIGSFDWEALTFGSATIGSSEFSGQIVDTAAANISDLFSINDVTINVTNVPEATSAGLLTLGMFSFFTRHRR